MRRILLALALLVAPLTTHAHGPVASGFSGGGGGTPDGSIVDADVSGSAAVAATKLSYAGSTDSVPAAGSVEATLDALDVAVDLKLPIADALASSQVVRTDAVTDDGAMIDLSAINQSAATEGLKLPQAATSSSTNCELYATGAGQVCWKPPGVLLIGDGSVARPLFGPAGALTRLVLNGFTNGDTGEWRTSPASTLGNDSTDATSGPSFVVMTTTSGATDVAKAFAGANGAIWPGQGQLLFTARVRLPVSPDASFKFFCGMSRYTGPGVSGANFGLMANGTTPYWYTAIGASGVPTETATTAPFAANTWYKLEIQVNPAWTLATFKVNGTTVATTSTLPTTAGVLPVCAILKASGTDLRVFHIDHLDLNYLLSTAN